MNQKKKKKGRQRQAGHICGGYKQEKRKRKRKKEMKTNG